MTLAPTRAEVSAPTDAAGAAAPTVTAFLFSRRDPRGVGELLEAVLTQTLPPDEVVVLDRTQGSPLPDAAAPATPTSERC